MHRQICDSGSRTCAWHLFLPTRPNYVNGHCEDIRKSLVCYTRQKMYWLACRHFNETSLVEACKWHSFNKKRINARGRLRVKQGNMVLPLSLCRKSFLYTFLFVTLRKHAYLNVENFTSKHWKFSDKNSNIFHISVQNIDCGYSLEPPRRGGSNEYQQFMFLSKNKKNNVYPCKPQFSYIEVGFKGVKIM